jgi:phosphotriesterase-related protein
MALVETLRGPIDSSCLGFTLMHEHIFVHQDGVLENFPTAWNRQEQIAEAKRKLGEAAANGVASMVDLTVLGLGRNIPVLLEVAAGVPLNIIVATGLYCLDKLPGFFEHQGCEAMVGLFARDIEIGIQGTTAKAGVIKAVTDESGVTPGIEKQLRAVARTHKRTGAPIITHSHSSSRRGLDQQRIFKEEGVDLRRVVIGHAGDSEDIDYLRQMMDQGSYIGMDRFGLENYLSTSKRVAVVAKLCGMGYADRMTLSHDFACYTTYHPNSMVQAMYPGLDHCFIPQKVLPALVVAGVSQAQIRQMTVENPRRIFEWKEAC